jgi:hypothetical protein
MYVASFSYELISLRCSFHQLIAESYDPVLLSRALDFSFF